MKLPLESGYKPYPSERWLILSCKHERTILHHSHPTYFKIPCIQLNSSSSFLTMQLWSGGKEIENVLLISLFFIWEQSWRISVHGQHSMCKILGSACLFLFTTMLELMHIMLFKARMWQSHVEIKDYSVAYFDRVAAFKAPYHWTQHIFIHLRSTYEPPS